MKITYIALLLFLVALAAYFYVSPNQALADIDRAIIAGDEARLDKTLDRPHLKKLAEAVLDGLLRAKMAAEAKTEGIGPAGVAYSESRRLIDTVVTPLMLSKGLPNFFKGKLDFVATSTQAPAAIFANAEVFFDSLTQAHTFISNPETGLRNEIILTRAGLFDWKITDVKFPIDAMMQQF